MKKTLEQLRKESEKIYIEQEKYYDKLNNNEKITKADELNYKIIRERLGVITEEIIKREQEQDIDDRRTFSLRPDIKEIRTRLKNIIIKTKMPIYFSRCEADGEFILTVKSSNNIKCDGYACDEYGEKTALNKISLTDLAGIVEFGTNEKI